MFKIRQVGQFKKDYKLCKKRNYKMELINAALKILIEKGELPNEYQPHHCSGTLKGWIDAHLAPDWVLLYTCDNTTQHTRRNKRRRSSFISHRHTFRFILTETPRFIVNLF